MTAWEAFALDCIATITIELVILAALWVARSRSISDTVEEIYGDWPHVERGQ